MNKFEKIKKAEQNKRVLNDLDGISRTQKRTCI